MALVKGTGQHTWMSVISKKDKAVEEPSCNYRAWSKRSIQSDKQEDTSIV